MNENIQVRQRNVNDGPRKRKDQPRYLRLQKQNDSKILNQRFNKIIDKVCWVLAHRNWNQTKCILLLRITERGNIKETFTRNRRLVKSEIYDGR